MLDYCKMLKNKERKTVSNYSFKVFWSDEDQAYIAVCSEFPTLSAFGDTPQEAIGEMETVLQMAIETFKEKNWPLPEPHTHIEYSGQMRVRFPKSVHARLATQAQEEGVSINSLINTFVSAGLAGSAQYKDIQAAMIVKQKRSSKERAKAANSSTQQDTSSRV
jgi:predicted HicB family RNase H-like nuclease